MSLHFAFSGLYPALLGLHPVLFVSAQSVCFIAAITERGKYKVKPKILTVVAVFSQNLSNLKRNQALKKIDLIHHR